MQVLNSLKLPQTLHTVRPGDEGGNAPPLMSGTEKQLRRAKQSFHTSIRCPALAENAGGCTEDTAALLSGGHLATSKGASLPLKFISLLIRLCSD